MPGLWEGEKDSQSKTTCLRLLARAACYSRVTDRPQLLRKRLQSASGFDRVACLQCSTVLRKRTTSISAWTWARLLKRWSRSHLPLLSKRLHPAPRPVLVSRPGCKPSASNGTGNASERYELLTDLCWPLPRVSEARHGRMEPKFLSFQVLAISFERIKSLVV